MYLNVYVPPLATSFVADFHFVLYATFEVLSVNVEPLQYVAPLLLILNEYVPLSRVVFALYTSSLPLTRSRLISPNTLTPDTGAVVGSVEGDTVVGSVTGAVVTGAVVAGATVVGSVAGLRRSCVQR